MSITTLVYAQKSLFIGKNCNVYFGQPHPHHPVSSYSWFPAKIRIPFKFRKRVCLFYMNLSQILTHTQWRRKGGGLWGLQPPLEVSWDLFFGISHFCSFKTVDLTRFFKKIPAAQAYLLTRALTKTTFHQTMGLFILKKLG